MTPWTFTFVNVRRTDFLSRLAVFFLSLMLVGCPKNSNEDRVKPQAESSKKTGQAPEAVAAEKEKDEHQDERGAVEQRCFEGSTEACDQLGH